MRKTLISVIALSVLILSLSLGPVQAQVSEDQLLDPVEPVLTGEELLNQDFQLPQYPPDEFYRGKVLEIVEQGMADLDGTEQPYQKVKVEISNGKEKGQTQVIDYGTGVALQPSQLVKIGDSVSLAKIYDASGTQYFLVDIFRLMPVIYMLIGFCLLVIFFGRRKGISSLFGLALTIAVLAFWIIPQILKGANPLITIISGSVVILFLSLYLSHGFNKRTSIALGSTLITLGLSVGLAVLAVSWARLSGLGSEEAYFLQVGALSSLNLKGLLLGGIIIGTLGILDDITTGQSAVVAELKLANSNLTFGELYKRGLSVGHEHIASLVNTLVLAYAGASFPILLLVTQNNKMPIWFTLNNEYFVEEVIRTLVGSTALILAVPITTMMAAYFWSKKAPSKSDAQQAHIH